MVAPTMKGRTGVLVLALLYLAGGVAWANSLHACSHRDTPDAAGTHVFAESRAVYDTTTTVVVALAMLHSLAQSMY